MNVYLGRQRVKLDPARSLGKGGEADVFDLGGGVALKVFKSPDHPDYQGQPLEQKAAQARIALHQKKLPAFPRGLPAQVVAPGELATDRSGRTVLGYAMPLVAPAEPLARFADPGFRRTGAPQAAVVELFRDLRAAVAGLHAAGVVIGDFNDLNVLVTARNQARLIDADSFQFGTFPCLVFTERFVDPVLCDPAAVPLRLVRPFGPGADWYAFAVLLMQSLLLVGPYGGVYRPKDPARRMPQAGRPLRRVTVFHPEVQVPKPATRFEVLPDDLLQHFHRVFEKDERGPFPEGLLDRIAFARCPRCGVEHARAACPLCSPSAAAAPVEVMRVRGRVVASRLFETDGTIVHACIRAGRIRFVYHVSGAYRREDGRAVLAGELDPALRFRILGESTLAGRGGEVAVLSPGRAPERLSVDSDGTGPAFDTGDRHSYWAIAGRLCRDALDLGPGAVEPLGEVLMGQTRIWAGPAFGLGLYRASNLSVAFLFDAERRGLNDGLSLPALAGKLTCAEAVLDEERAWLMLGLALNGRARNLCLAYSRKGELLGSAEGEPGDGSWLEGLSGRCAVRGMLLAATDAGIARVELSGQALRETRRFPDAEPFVDAGTQLLAGGDGLYAVGRRVIDRLTMN